MIHGIVTSTTTSSGILMADVQVARAGVTYKEVPVAHLHPGHLQSITEGSRVLLERTDDNLWVIIGVLETNDELLPDDVEGYEQIMAFDNGTKLEFTKNEDGSYDTRLTASDDLTIESNGWGMRTGRDGHIQFKSNSVDFDTSGTPFEDSSDGGSTSDGSTSDGSTSTDTSIEGSDLAFDTATQAELDAHAGDSEAHHARYTDSEAVAAIESVAEALKADISGDADTVDGKHASELGGASSHSDLTGVSTDDHHARYTDSEAIAALESLANALDVDITGDADTVDGKHAGDFAAASHETDTENPHNVKASQAGAVDKSGDEINGNLLQTYGTDNRTFAALEPDKPASSRLPAGQTTASLMEQNEYDDNIHAKSDNSGQLTYEEAVAYANDRGGRLPTIEEVEGLVTAGSGSGYDNEIIWTQTKAGSGEVYVQYGKWPNFTSDANETRQVYKTDGTDTAVVRWVAEADQTGLPASTSYAQDNIFLASGSGTNINGSSWTDVSWNSTDIIDSAYTFNGTSVTIQEGGTYEVVAEADFSSTGASRQNPNIGIQQNGNWTGVIGRSGYMRDAEAHNHASIHARAVITATSGDTIHAEATGDGDTSGTITPDRAQFYIKKLNR
ncbi:baseplate assembly protein V [Halorubrum virus HRTV-16]|nr:baseplate assembly protein V [Halorubrum virus HRTV-16]